MEELNIAKILQYAPKGLPLYSPVLCEVRLSEVLVGGLEAVYPIQVKRLDRTYNFTEHGRYFDGKGECLLFPSKDHRTWDNWQDILLPQSIGCVCVNTCTPEPIMFICTSTGTVFSDNSGSTWEALIGQSGNYLKSSRYASPEESKQFFDKLKAKGYEWNGEKIVKTTPTPPFKVGDWVVRKDGTHFADGSSCAQITNITSDSQHWFNGTWLYVDEIRLWTIRDAKPGDILVTRNKNIFIFKSISNHTVYDYCGLYLGRFTEYSAAVNSSAAKQLPTDYVLATKEQRNLLFQKMKEASYKWDAEKKELKKMQRKFDISTLQPFDKVLVRDYKRDKWYPNLYSFYDSDTVTEFRFCTINVSWRYCIPYNDDTKHLVGTTDDAPEFYKVWE